MSGEARSVEVRLFAAARAAAGVPALQAAPGSLASVLAQAVEVGPGLAAVLPRCSVLVNGAVAHDEGIDVPAGAQVDVLPPFAGG